MRGKGVSFIVARVDCPLYSDVDAAYCTLCLASAITNRNQGDAAHDNTSKRPCLRWDG